MTEYMINLPIPIKTQGVLKQINDILDKKNNEVFNWSGIHTVYRFFYLYLFKKYKHNCRLYFDKNLCLDLNNEFNTLLKINLMKQAEQFKRCYNKGSDMIIIPLRYATGPSSGHANFLLFKRNPNHIIERFEPYGTIISPRFVDKAINYFIAKINKLIDKPIRYSPIEESCPQIGIQYREEYIDAQLKQANEGGGYCVIWSMFFTELSLANPQLNFKELTDIIYNINTPGFYMRDISRGYVYLFYEKMAKYFGQYISPIMDFEKYIKHYYDKSIIMRKHIDYASDVLDELFNIEMELYENPHLTIEELNRQTIESIRLFKEKYMNYSRTSMRKYYKNIIIKLYIKKDILNKMISNKENLDKFTPLPIAETQPEVLVFDLRSSTISKVATPLKSTKSKKQTIEKVKPPCKPGKERNAEGRCVKKIVKQSNIEKPKSKTLKTKPPCKPGKERNAEGRCVKKRE